MQTFGIFGGYGSAKSTASLWEYFIRALENPKGVGLLTAPTLQLLKRTSIKTLLDEIIPPPLLVNYHKSDGVIELYNGFVIYTIPSDDEEKLRSINAGLIHMEEASGIKRSIYDQLLTRMRHKYTKNKAMFVCSNPDMGWIKEVLVNNPARKNPSHPEHEDFDETMHTFIWPTNLNYHLPEDFIEKLSKNKPEWWIKRFLEGSFDHASGMVYPNWSSAVIEDLPNFSATARQWDKMFSLDHGLRNPTAFLSGTIDPKEGILYIFQEYYKPDSLVPQNVEVIKPRIESVPYGKLRFMVADPAIRNKADPTTGKSVQFLYQEQNLFFQLGNNDVDAGINRLNSYIDRGKIKIFRSCVNLIREGLNYKYKEASMDDDKNLDEKPIKKDDHAMDSLRYMIMMLPFDPDQLAYTPVSRLDLYSTADDDDDDDWDEEPRGKRDFLSYA